MPAKKSKDDRKDDFVRVRVTAEQKDLLSRAAAKDGLDISAWMRFVCLKVAAGEITVVVGAQKGER